MFGTMICSDRVYLEVYLSDNPQDGGFGQEESRRLAERYNLLRRAFTEETLAYRIIAGQLRDLGAILRTCG